MSAPEYQPDVFPLRAAGTLTKPSRVENRQMRDAEARAAWTAVCKQVDKRDGGRCRVCLKRCNPNAVAMMDKAHRHHIIYRSAGGPDLDYNVVTLCASCHDRQHRGLIDVRGSATGGIEIWHPDGRGGWFLWRRETMPFVYERD